MNMSIYCSLAAALLLQGCVTPPPANLSASGGSRAAGVVEFSYEYGIVDPAPSSSIGLDEALTRCKAWGYKGVLPFNKRTSRCNHFNSFLRQCDSGLTTLTYQCTVVSEVAK